MKNKYLANYIKKGGISITFLYTLSSSSLVSLRIWNLDGFMFLMHVSFAFNLLITH